MIIVVRHGQTEWNRVSRFQGHQDSPLTRIGEWQAETVARFVKLLRLKPIDTLISSPLGRAHHSARIIAHELGHPVESIKVDDRLLEVAFGNWEGLTREEIAERHPDELKARQNDRWRHAPPGAESYADAAARVADWLAEQDEARTILAVTHAGICRVLRHVYGGMPEADAVARTIDHLDVHLLENGNFSTMRADSGNLDDTDV